MLKHTISRNLKILRLQKGLSQQKLADKTKFQVRYLSQLENDPQNITASTLERLAKGLGVSPVLLVSDIGNEEEIGVKLPKKTAPGIDAAIQILQSFRSKID